MITKKEKIQEKENPNESWITWIVGVIIIFFRNSFQIKTNTVMNM